MDYRNTSWLSGFADGEGCFAIGISHSTIYSLEFTLALRADDKAILSKLQECFGGCLYFAPVSEKQRQRIPGSNPRHDWRVSARADILRLIEYFDRFPLQTKKAADYKVWREAAFVYYRYSKGTGGGRTPRWLCSVMDDYKAEIERLKEYEAQPQYSATEAEEPQLCLNA